MGADADRMALRYIEENAFGVTPDGNVASASVTMVNAAKSYATASGFDVFYPKQTILVAGATDPLSNGYKTVVSASATTIVVEETIGANEGPTASMSIKTAYKSTRFTGESLEMTTDTVESQEISDDRQVSCTKRTDVSAQGDINFELSYGTFDDFIEASLMGTWSSIVTATAATYTAAIHDNRIIDSGDGIVSDGYLAKQWILISGFTLTANNGYAKIGSIVAAGTLSDLAPVVKDQIEIGDTTGIFDKVTLTGILRVGNSFTIAGDATVYVITAESTAAANEIAVTFTPASVATQAAEAVVTVDINEAMILTHKTLVAEAEGDTVTINMAAQVVNGVAERTFSLEKEMADVTEFQPFSGMAVDGMSLNVAVAALITGAFAFLGKREEVGAAASTGDGTPQASTTVCPMNAVDEVQALFEDGSSREAQSFTVQQINNARARKIIGTLGADELGYGRIGVSGLMTIFFESRTTRDKYLNFDDVSIAILFVDNDGNAYVFDFPKCNFTAGPCVAGGPNTDLMAAMSYMATKHATEDVTMRVARFPA